MNAKKETLLISATPDNNTIRQEAKDLGFTEAQIITNRMSYSFGWKPSKINGTTVEYKILPGMIDDFRRVLKKLNLTILVELDLYIEEKKEIEEGAMEKPEESERAMAA